MKLKVLKSTFIKGVKFWIVAFLAFVLISIYNLMATLLGMAVGSTYLMILLLLLGLVVGILVIGVLVGVLWGWD